MQVGDLFAALGFKVDHASYSRANSAIQSVGRALDGLAQKAQSWGSGIGGTLTRLAAAAGIGKLVESGLKFNSTAEDTKNQIAGMMALATKTDLNDNLGKASELLGHLRERAAKLPGTTAEYAQMLGALTQPILDAKLSMQDLEDLTVNSVVGAKALGVEWSAAARDVDQALRGSFHSNDVFTGKLLGSIGFKGEEGRARFNAMTAKERGQTLKQALTQKQLAQLAAAQGETASGKFSTFVDTMQQTLGRITAPLFKVLVGHLENVNKWLDKNSDKVQKFASDVGGALVTAFGLLKDVITFMMENKEVVGIVLAIGAGFALMSSPILAVIAGVLALTYLIVQLGEIASKVFEEIDLNMGARIKELEAQGMSEEAAVAAYRAEKEAKGQGGGTGVDVGNFGVNAGMFAPGAADTPGTTPGVTPSIFAPGAAAVGTTNNTLTLNPTVNITGVSDPKTAGDIVEQKIRQIMSDANATLRGGRR